MRLAKPRRIFCSLATTLILSSSLSGCDALLDLTIDCIDNDGPVLSPGVLPNPILNQEYNQVVHVGIRNEPFDDAYDYLFELRGRLPSGIQFEGAGRDLRLFGTATELGNFNFEVNVAIEDGIGNFNDTSGICFTTDSIDYQWTVQPM
jgi:hypothetical protein